MKAQMGVVVHQYSSFNLETRWGMAVEADHSTPENDPVPIV